jgi:hypothetical protein
LADDLGDAEPGEIDLAAAELPAFLTEDEPAALTSTALRRPERIFGTPQRTRL